MASTKEIGWDGPGEDSLLFWPRIRSYPECAWWDWYTESLPGPPFCFAVMWKVTLQLGAGRAVEALILG
ncbi:hypothetical protein AV530_015558 [Patagioenas fasciata monilis]|uniref:Uncharacterized protein n=1 Tax=Patagioenas fasciata monilis TaxID=372326 RepID=A0A1V4KI04_PATFA|nr:hypothetical protein AV530_015558 [Patagioenas fasciata monilis]